MSAVRALSPVTLDGQLFARADVRWREVGGEIAVWSNGNVELLPMKARALWRLLAVPQSFEDLAHAVASANGVHPAMFVSDVAEALELLIDRGLVDAVTDVDD